MSTVIVVAGGDPIQAGAVEGIADDDFVIAADSGLDRAAEVGLAVDLVVGDLDSVDPDTLARHVGPVERHPVDKDATDLELALRAAVTRAPERILVVGGDGGRLDHLVANALVLTTLPAAITVEWRPGPARVHVVHGERSIDGVPGALISLIPVWGPVRVRSTTGLRWPLRNDTLELGTSRGVSNELTRAVATISVAKGTLLVIAPGQS